MFKKLFHAALPFLLQKLPPHRKFFVHWNDHKIYHACRIILDLFLKKMREDVILREGNYLYRRREQKRRIILSSWSWPKTDCLTGFVLPCITKTSRHWMKRITWLLFVFCRWSVKRVTDGNLAPGTSFHCIFILVSTDIQKNLVLDEAKHL